MSTENRYIEAILTDADADLELAEAAAELGNRHGAFHLQQAAEKLTKAVRVHRGLRATKEHRIDTLVKGAYSGEPVKLPDADPWRERLLSLEPLSDYATTFRYPTPTGKLKKPPEPAEVVQWAGKIRELVHEARSDLLAEATKER